MSGTDHVLVLCPMSVESAHVRRAVRRAGLGERVRVVQTGIGKDAIVRCLRSAQPERGSACILAGVCGGLVTTADVPRIVGVIDTHGHAWTPTLGGEREHRGTGASDDPGVTLVAVDHVVESPTDKRTLAQTTGAAIVDMESHAFASACEELGVRWTVVRGVSDTPEDVLPEEVLGWVTPEGNTRPVRAVLDMLRHPTHVPHVVAALRRTSRVMPKVAERVVEIAGSG